MTFAQDKGKDVTVRLDADPDKPGRILVGVRVRSRMKEHVRKVVQIDPGKFTRPVDLMKAIGIAAASCAEQLGEDCGDHLDPSRCYKDALAEAHEAFTRHHEKHKAVQLELRNDPGLEKLRKAIKEAEQDG